MLLWGCFVTYIAKNNKGHCLAIAVTQGQSQIYECRVGLQIHFAMSIRRVSEG